MKTKEIINSSSVVLVSGGAKGITAKCVIELANYAHCKFILVGRSLLDFIEPEWAGGCEKETELKHLIMENLQKSGNKPTPSDVQNSYRSIISRREIISTLEAIQSAGGDAIYLPVDITNKEDLQNKLPGCVDKFGPITGIIHGAGNLADKLIEKKTEKDYDLVIEPKVNGLENLLGVVSTSQLDFIVLFSSIAGFYGNVGQSDYAMANEILNKSAYILKQSLPNCQVISFNWGPWDAGMVTESLKEAFIKNNIQLIPIEVGVKLLLHELISPTENNVQIVVGNSLARPIEKLSTTLKEFQIHRNLSLEINPFLNDHRLGKNAVLPATCAASWMIHGCEQLYPGYQFFRMEKFRVLKGIVFDGKLSEDYVLEIKEISKTPINEIQFDVIVSSKNTQDRKLFHYSASITLMNEIPTSQKQPTLEDFGIDRTQSLAGSTFYEDGTLFHGPSLQGVRQVFSVDQDKLAMQINLPEINAVQQGQFSIGTTNPFINDAVVQSMLIWTQSQYNAPCLPTYLEKLEQYRSIPFGVTVDVLLDIQFHNNNAVTGNIFVQNPEGIPYVIFYGLEGTISKHLKRLISKKAETTP